MRWTTVFIALAATLLPAMPAAAERDLAAAVTVVIQEATFVEQDAAATAPAFRGTPLARQLRRGKKSLEDALAQHREENWKGTGVGLAKGLGKLLKAFRSQDRQPGLEAIDAVFEEVMQFVTENIDDFEVRVNALPDSSQRNKAGRQVSNSRFFLHEYFDNVGSDRSKGYLLDAYIWLGKAAKKIRRLEGKGKVDIAHLGKLIPGNLPRGTYSIGVETNGVPSIGAYWTGPFGPAKQKQAIKSRLQGIAGYRVDGRTCQESCTGTPFDGTIFTVTVVLTCATGGTTTVVFTMRKVELAKSREHVIGGGGKPLAEQVELLDGRA